MNTPSKRRPFVNGRSQVNLRAGAQEGWKAMAHANKVFGPDNWSREVVEARCATSKDRDGLATAAYVAKVRITVCIGSGNTAREAYGCAEGRGTTPFEAHEKGMKAAELDATMRALATLGKAFGLGTFVPPTSPAKSKQPSRGEAHKRAEATPIASQNETAPDAQSVSPRSSEMALAIPKPRRVRSVGHLAFVRRQPCLVCGRSPVDAHHIRFAQPKAMARKVSDEFTVPLCRRHHEQLHSQADERGWWDALDIDPLKAAADLWNESAALLE